MVSAFLRKSFNRLSSVVRPRFNPPSSAFSTRTSNHDSMLRATNCTDTPYTSTPGSTATSVKSSTRRSVSFEPKTPAFNFWRSEYSW